MTYLTQRKSINTTMILLAALAFITSCSSTKEEQERQYTIANMDKAPPIHVYVVKTRAKDDIGALNEAADTAHDFCAKTNGRSDIIDHVVEYQGLTDKQKKIIKQANKELDKSIGTYSERDYKVTIRFRCLPRSQIKSMVKVANQMAGAEVGNWWENK